MVRYRLAYEDPDERLLKNHPVHGNRDGWSDRLGYWNVNNYENSFIPASCAPVCVQPCNAVDFGFQECLASQRDMLPEPDGYPRPAMVKVRGRTRLRYARSGVNAAFYYTLPEFPRCNRRSCRFTHWEYDSNTDEVILDKCWGCRRLGARCPMKGFRVARRAIAGDVILDDLELPFPGRGAPKRPKNWVPLRRVPRGGLGGIGGDHGRAGGGGGGGLVSGYKRDDEDSDDESNNGEGSQGGDDENRGRGDQGSGYGGADDDDEEENGGNPEGSSNGTRAGSTQQSRRPKHKSGKRYRTNGGKSEHHRYSQYARQSPSRPTSTPETPLRGKRQRATTADEDDEMESPPRRRGRNHELPRIEDLFREDSVDDLDYDLNIGTFDNGRRDANSTSNRLGSPGEPSQNMREVSEPAVFPGVGRLIIEPSKEKSSTGTGVNEDPKEKDAVEISTEVKEEVDEKPLVVKGSGNDEDNDIEYLKTEYRGKGTEEEPWTFDA